MEQIHNETLFTEVHQRNNESLRWSAIIAGVTICFAYQILMSFLGSGIGLTSLSISHPRLFTLGIGAIVWLSMSGVISMLIGGWFAGMLSNAVCKYKLCCYGILTWSIATILTIMIATTTSSTIIGGVINMLNFNEQSIDQISGDINDHSQIKPDVVLITDQQENVNKQLDSYTTDIGKTSIVIFIAFLMSGFASVVGAVYGGKQKKKLVVK